jgi:acyl carrier protein
MDGIYEKLTAILVDLFDDDGIVATPELTADDVDGWDSLAHVRFMLTVERAFGIVFPATEMASFKSVGDLASAIATRTGRS